MGVRTVEWGEHVDHVVGYAFATPGSNRVHLVDDHEPERWGLAICDQSVHMDHTAEYVSGRTLCPKCEQTAAQFGWGWHLDVDEGLWSWNQYGHGPDFTAYLDQITDGELAKLGSVGQRKGYPFADAVIAELERRGANPAVEAPPEPPAPPAPRPLVATNAMIVATIPERELVHRRVMAEIIATGLLDAEWEPDLASPAAYHESATWRYRKGSGWLTISAPGSAHNYDGDAAKGFRVDAAFGGSETREGLRISGVYAATPTEALVNAINSLTGGAA